MIAATRLCGGNANAARDTASSPRGHRRGTTGLRTAAVIVVFTCPAGAEKVRVTADGGEVARLVRGRVPAEVVLAERRRPCVASQLPPRSPLGSPG